ncbi:helix-turn-helix domain-containing GNAT family N-acetyltransferase [Duganella violaceipulchra]|uniref:DNA-binding MarR family transcriptional regulator/GNAT superfamily N-acetyltransferase n=1 Tax=Duganella violaceipulchra TaxID=2849652 RepID=A0AA41H3V1_9BURK|nr:helix-turn-helix domain-containing GNAT family N-acetyltransferase [Duganella violaceicalia]MBV6320407.1 helix-turn-helix domain-containing GNAT family N-acetyltransferase [Duganella violaceicalia]MCP2012242.1 DNA-binding MarR family transcriptional regulator/GNAT superfamily N-acetyltransferase [Duganella violaceicalia]
MPQDMQQQAYIVRQFNRYYTVHLGLLRGRYLDTDYSLSEGRVMYELSMHPGCTANHLRNKLDLDAGYMSRLVRSLSERGLINGVRSEQDKRATLLSLTDAGQAVIADINHRASAETVRMLGQLGAAQRTELLEAMRTVQHILSTPATRVVRATAAQLDDARHLLVEYFDIINVVLRDDDEAIRAFLNDASSAMWIAYVDGEAAACVAMRALAEVAGATECKRLYVADRFRRRGLAEALMQALESHAAQAGYDAVYLDTKDDLHAAIRLYEQLGYERCERYNDNPQATIFMRKRLR